MSRRLYDKPAAAEQLSVSVKVLERLMKDGKLESVQVGRRRLIPAEALDDYVDRIRRAS